MVAMITVWMIQGNDGVIIDTPDRSEYWITKDGAPHALMLSCPLDKRHELEQAVAEMKALDPTPS